MLLQIAVAGLIVAAAALAYGYGARLQPSEIGVLLAANPWAPLLFVLAHIVVSLTFIPRTLLAIAAGLLFGLWAGIALTTIGAMAGSIAGFMLVRALHRGGLALDGRRALAWLALLKQRLDDSGWRGVALVRLMPLPHTPVNYAFGLTAVSFADYAWGSFVGLLPATVVAVGVGAAGGAALTGSLGWLEPSLIGLAAVAASALLPRALRWLRRR